jgi:hypothetical protein
VEQERSPIIRRKFQERLLVNEARNARHIPRREITMTPEEEKGRDTERWIKGRKGSRIPREMSIYVLTESSDDQPCKVGSAADIAKRLIMLNCGNHRPLFVRAKYTVEWLPGEKWLAYQRRVQEKERKVHEKLARFRLRGEWFGTHYRDASAAIAEML